MHFLFGLGIAGSIASIVSLLLPADRWRTRLIHAAYTLMIVILAGTFARNRAELERVRSVQRAAAQIVADREMLYTHAGFVQAGLGFLELHQATFPGAYARALKLCEERDCWSNREGSDIVSIAFSMSGLLRGIATTHENR